MSVQCSARWGSSLSPPLSSPRQEHLAVRVRLLENDHINEKMGEGWGWEGNKQAHNSTQAELLSRRDSTPRGHR